MIQSAKNPIDLSRMPVAAYDHTSSRKSARRFLATASISAMALMMSTAAQAQILPPECAPSPATAGDTVTCEGAITAPIETIVDDLTLIIPDETTVTVSPGTAINVSGGGSLNVMAANGSSVSGSFGIRVNNTGSGTTTVTAGDSTGEYSSTSIRIYGGGGSRSTMRDSGAGIDAYGGGNSGNLSVTSTGTATGGEAGIHVYNRGTGTTTITAVDSVGEGTYSRTRTYGSYGGEAPRDPSVRTRDIGTGIYARGGEYSGDLSVSSTGTASGGENGIRVRNNGTGTTTITAVDSAGVGTNSLTRTYGGYSGRPSEILTTDRIYGTGIDAYGGENSGDLSVTSTGTATGGEAGIRVRNEGTGTTTITAVDSLAVGITEYFRYYDGSGFTTLSRDIGTGIYARGGENSGDLSVTSTGTASGGRGGIRVSNRGAGDVTVTALDSTGTNNYSDGIYASTFGSSTYLGGGEGFSYTPATGDISITSTGTATGGENGIRTRNRGTGNTTITAVDSIANGTRRYYSGGEGGEATFIERDLGTGIYAYGGENSGDLSVSSTGTATGGRAGIRVRNNGTGATTVTSADSTATNDDVGGEYGGEYGGPRMVRLVNGPVGIGGGVNSAGINAYGGESSGDLSVTSTGTATGGNAGIFVGNYGVGMTTVNAVDTTATNNYGVGIHVIHGRDPSFMGGEYGGEYGRLPTKDVIIQDVIQNGANPAAHNVSVTSTGMAMGGEAGIEVANFGTGTTTVTAVDSTGLGTDSRTRSIGGYNGIPLELVTYDRSFGAGISVYGGEASGDLSVTSTGTATGGEAGIRVRNEGTGTTTITAVDSAGVGIFEYVRTYGGGEFSVNSRDIGTGIYARGGENSGDLSVTSTGTASGGREGIRVRNNGTGMTTVNAVDSTGTGNYSYGISVSTGRYFGGENVNSGDVTVNSTGTAMGGYGGISVRNNGTGDVTVNAVDSLGVGNERGYGYGISVRNSLYGGQNTNVNSGDVTVNSTGTVTGGEIGIYASNVGTGALTVNAVDSTGTNNYGAGIDVRNRTIFTFVGGEYGGEYSPIAPSGDISITSTGEVSGGRYGIRARNFGTGTLTINAVDSTATGIIEYGGEGGGVGAESPMPQMAIGTGIYAYGGEGSGDVNVTATGDVSGGEDGIHVRNNGVGTTTITVADVTGGDDGIEVNAGTGALTVNLNGDVTAGDIGLLTTTQDGTTLVQIQGSTIAGGNIGIATNGAMAEDDLDIRGVVNGGIYTYDAADLVELSDTATVNGVILLGAGDDIFSDEGGSFTTVNGGEDSDTFNFNAGRVLMNSGGAGDSVTEFEIYNFNNEISTLAGLHQGLTAVNIANSGGLNLGSGASVSGIVTNDGSLSIAQGGVGTADLLGGLWQSASGSITFDRTSETTADLLNVAGNLNLGGTLNLNQSDLFLETITLIDGSGTLSGAFDTVTGLNSGLFLTQSVELDVANADVNLVTNVEDVASAASAAGLTFNETELANDLFNGLSAGGLSDDLKTIALRTGFVSSSGDLARVLEELSPELVHAGAQVVQNSQMMFRNNLLDQPGSTNSGPGIIQTASLGKPMVGRSQSGPKVWGSSTYAHIEQDGTAGTIDFETDGFEIAAGVSNIGSGAVSFGIAAGYTDLDTDTSVNAFGGAGADDVNTELLRAGVHARVKLNSQGDGINAYLDAAASYGDGTNEITQNITATPVATSIRQTGKVDVNNKGAVLRLTLNGSGGQDWAIKPYIKGAIDNFNQDAFTLGTGATQLAIAEIDNTRYTIGYGADFQHDWTDGGYARIGASGMHHSGDTDGVLLSSFTALNGSGFTTIGTDVKNQYVIDGGIGKALPSGWTVGAHAFGQFGDLEGYGGGLNFAKKF